MSREISFLNETDNKSFKHKRNDLVSIDIQNYDGLMTSVVARVVDGQGDDGGIIYNLEVIRHDRNPEWAWLIRHSRHENFIELLDNDILEDVSRSGLSAESHSHLKKEAIAELLEEANKNKDPETYSELLNIYMNI